MADRNSTVARGLMAGFLAATTLAAWFLVIDLIEGRPLYTPAFVASALMGRETVEIGLGIILAYTALHYAAFLLIGMGVAWLMSKLETVPSFLLGLVLGFLLFDLIFYAGVVITGVNVVESLGWPAVLAGNLLAGIVLMGYLHLAGAAPRVSWWEVLGEHRILREGMVAGLLGAIVVALWFLIFDAVAGRVFFTPAALGSALLFGARSAAEVQVTAATVLLYTIIHVGAFLVIGLVAAALALAAEEQPPILLGMILIFAAFEALFIGMLAIFATWILGTLGWWNIAVGNLLAALAIGAYLWGEHPALRREIRELSGPSLEHPA
ncbi:MAG TPA: hypothetical protein VF212_03045 [Longimicrobiales bacterium]